MPDETLHVDRFILTEPRERARGGWIYRAHSPDDPTEYMGWVYPNPCQGAALQEVQDAVDLARAIRHPNLLQLHGAGHKRPVIGPSAGYLYAITDRIDDARSVEAMVLPQAPLPVDALIGGLQQLVAAIGAMAAFPHSHGWLGPEHCFVREDGQLVVINPWQGWVLDRLRQNLTTGTSDWQYTWVAPETVFDPDRIGIGSDLFTACAIGFTLATGQVPFDSASALTLDPALFQLQVPDPRSLRPDLPEGFARLLQRGLASRPQDRYHQAIELIEDLHLVMQGGQPSRPPAAQPAPAAQPPARRQRGISSSGRMAASTERGARSASSSVTTVPRSGPRSRPHPRPPATGSGRNPLPIILVLGAAAALLTVILALAAGRAGEPAPVPVEPERVALDARPERPRRIASDPPPALRIQTEPPAITSPPTGIRSPQRGGLAALRTDLPEDLGSALPAVEPPPVLPATVVDGAALRPGLVQRSYLGQWSILPAFDRLDAVSQQVVRRLDLDARPRDHDFGMVFEGYLEVSRDGVHAFLLEVDDAARLIIAGTEVILKDGHNARGEPEYGAISLQAGYHPFRLEYMQGIGDHYLALRWRSAAIQERPVVGALHHLPPSGEPIEPPPAPEPQPLAGMEPESTATGGMTEDPEQQPTPAPDPTTLERLREAVGSVLAGRSAPRDLEQAPLALLTDLGKARDRLSHIALAQAKRITARHVTVDLHRTSLEVRGLGDYGLDFTTTDGRSQVRMGWDKIGMSHLVVILRAVLYDLSPEDREDVRLVASALGPVDPKLQRHRELLERLHAEPEAEPASEPAAGQDAVGAAALRPADARQIVLLAKDADRSQAGADWTLVRDSSAIGGQAWRSREAIVRDHSCQPEADCLIFRFQAKANQVYQVWLRGRCSADPFWESDAVLIRFMSPMRFQGVPCRINVRPERFGDTAAINGWGGAPEDWYWCSGRGDLRWDQPTDEEPVRVVFARDGVQEIRIFLQEGSSDIDCIWLSTTQIQRPQIDPRQ